ncbi:hypothetical protein NC653_040064 [Populus alba x Populus x berolinensis]|uniref:Uncharacterized protein n=1 Tax=Populus alba x Populus x berolinensis TaxID=444605 RepID=A0AAD6PS54_9ROSI|nr:hypothetical protein NC653_040064 [Populus alba x Populus x berolinensis]
MVLFATPAFCFISSFVKVELKFGHSTCRMTQIISGLVPFLV